MKLNDKLILVTGGSGLIGAAIVDKLVQEGARVINIDLNPGQDDSVEFVKCDITDPESIKSTVDKIGRDQTIHGLVNNAYPRTSDWGARFEDIPLDSWQKNVDYQMNSYFYFSQQVLIHMKEKGEGSIVNICSTYGVVAPDFTTYDGTEMTSPAAYSAIKGGLINFTRYLASYYGKYNIRINGVSPGGIFDHQPQPFVDNYQHKVPLKRMGKPQDIAPAVAFLLSDEASYITGHNLMVDGGWTCI